jgi:tetratricopeptide (TPR) repeat protein
VVTKSILGIGKRGLFIAVLVAGLAVGLAGPVAADDCRGGPEPTDAEGYFNRGNACSKAGHYERAIQDFDEAIELDPEYAEAYYNRGLAYMNLKQYEEAIPDFDRFIEIQPDGDKLEQAPHNLRGVVGELNQDEKELLFAYTHRGFAYFYRGLAYAQLGHYERAIRDYDKADEFDSLISVNLYTASYRGQAYVQLGQYQRAIQDYDKIIEMLSGVNWPFVSLVQAYINRGVAYSSLGQHQRAIEDFDKAIDYIQMWRFLDEDNIHTLLAQAVYNRGLGFQALGEEAKAAEDFARAAELDPQYAEPE